MSLSQFPLPRRISASLLSQPMRLTSCSYKKRTWKGQYECLNSRGIEFGGESISHSNMPGEKESTDADPIPPTYLYYWRCPRPTEKACQAPAGCASDRCRVHLEGRHSDALVYGRF